MKKWPIYTLGLLALNVLVTFAGGLAFMLFLLGDDPILASVPAIFALPAIVLQPWFLVFLVVPYPLILAPILTTLITILVYGWLDAGGRLERPKLFLSRFQTRRTFVVVSGVVLLLVAVAVARYVDFPALKHGAPPHVQVPGLEFTDARYYCLGQFIDSEWLWQARISESELTRLANEVGLQSLDRKDVPDDFRSMPPYWWRPSLTDRTRILSTPKFPMGDRGPDGRHAMASWNPDDQVLHMWIKNNF
jgi:hypothetical protein